MNLSMPSDRPLADNPLGDASLRRSLESFVRRRVAAPDVDDVVQTVLCDALAAPSMPRDPKELRLWLLGIARHKVADVHRRGRREPPAELPEIEALPAPLEARELARWAERQAGQERDAQKTLDWMAREGDGEKLEAIAAEERLPAARVRQRVSRMRRWMKERWRAELATAMAIVVALLAVWLTRTKEEPAPEARPDDVRSAPLPSPVPAPNRPEDEAREARRAALEACTGGAYRACIEGLDAARALDPAGDTSEAVVSARRRAEAAIGAGEPPDTSSKVDPSEIAPAPKVAPRSPRKSAPKAVPELAPTSELGPAPKREVKPASSTEKQRARPSRNESSESSESNKSPSKSGKPIAPGGSAPFGIGAKK
jgi:DNA-directed RNA polymerase specialized sigma24 family protein